MPEEQPSQEEKVGSGNIDRPILRLKCVLDVLAEDIWTGRPSGNGSAAGHALTEAVARAPFTKHEGELLSGGIPRGYKALTTASAKLVKAGWLVKGRSGWTITEDGLRAVVAFPDANSFGEALAAGTRVPEMPVPMGPAKKPAAKRNRAKVKAVDAFPQPVDAFPQPVDAFPQPEAVAVAGNFSSALGAPEDWAPRFDEVQLALDPADQSWKLTADLPAGSYAYKIALDRSWTENYGAFGVRDGADHQLHHAGGSITFNYDHRTHDISITTP
ncbi:glycosidase [Arthrobacter sp. H5]|uniref:pullulanase X25 domain-containing protein n=1 Tax=Arthrobacter sp. H5 TaxID=1267973 RepID=UPI0020A69F13|nr:glycosidase [Arthrobacter sp. H5]